MIGQRIIYEFNYSVVAQQKSHVNKKLHAKKVNVLILANFG